MRFCWIKKRTLWLWVLRGSLTAACIAMLVFIFSNSLKTGEESAEQSLAVVDTVQKVAPNSTIATATGSADERLHMIVRSVAHFAEFALLGALLLWCAASYTLEKEGLLISLPLALAVPMIDETLQYFVANRGAEWKDVCIDMAGGVMGIMFALLTVILGLHIYKKRKKMCAEATRVVKKE